MNDIRYRYCAPEIVGTPDNWGYAYYLSEADYASVKEAEKAGINNLEHDDFVIAEFKGQRCMAVHIDEKRHDRTSKDFGEYVDGINCEIGEAMEGYQ